MKLAKPPAVASARVCSDHFVDENYQRKVAVDKDGIQQTIRTVHLVKDVVPSVFDFTGYRYGETDRTTTHNPRRTERRQQTRESRRSIPVSPQNCPA